MAASEALLPWGGLQWNRWSGAEEIEEEESMQTLKTQLQAMTLAAQAKDVAFQDLQRRLQAALEKVEQGRAKEAALLRRAEIAEAAEEALASQIGELEAEAYASITRSNKTQHGALQGAEIAWLVNTEEPAMREKQRIVELERGLQVARNDADYWKRRCIELEAEVGQGRVREAALLKRAEKAEAAEEAIAAEMAEVEAEAYERITVQHNKVEYGATMKSESEPEQPLQERNTEILEPIGNCYVAELERRLAEAARALEEVRAKLQAGEKERALEKGDGNQVMMVKKNEGKGSEETLLSLSLHELAGVVKLRLWSPSSLTLSSAKGPPCHVPML